MDQLITRNDYNLSLLILHGGFKDYDKGYWENAAKVIAHKSDTEIETILPDVLVWLQNSNWPGSKIILDRMNEMPKEIILKHRLDVLEMAMASNDTMWIEWL